MPAHYVLNTARPERSWVLNLEPQTLQECRRMINWQVSGNGSKDDWTVCHYDRATATFQDAAGAVYRPDRGPYTAEAWNAFLDAL